MGLPHPLQLGPSQLPRPGIPRILCSINPLAGQILSDLPEHVLSPEGTMWGGIMVEAKGLRFLIFL